MAKFQENLIREINDFLEVLKTRDEKRAAHEAAVASEGSENENAAAKAAALETEAATILSTAKDEADAMLEEAVRESERLQREASEKAEALRAEAAVLLSQTSGQQASLVTETYIERRAAELLFEREQQFLISIIMENPLEEDPTPEKPAPLPPLPPLPGEEGIPKDVMFDPPADEKTEQSEPLPL